MDVPTGPAQDDLRSLPDHSDGREEPRAGRPGTGLRILVVDDESGIRRVLHRMLGRNHRVETARDGHEAWELLAADACFDVILSDLMMPRMTGMQLHEALAAARPEQARRMVFMTGGTFTEHGRQLLERSGRPVLDKPLSRESLQDAFDAVLETESACEGFPRGSRKDG